MDPKFAKLDQAFNPGAVAVVGDKEQNNNFLFLRSLSAFEGDVYSVNIDPKEAKNIEALGVKNYMSLKDVPDPVDYVIVAVPREAAPIILQDCIDKNVGAVTMFTSGFAETGTAKGIELADTITAMAREHNINLIGPNCMGIFNPSLGLRNNPTLYAEKGGSVGFISQSGGHAINFGIMGYNHGIKISKSVSYGNGYILDSTDYCEYFLQDPATQIIALYIEGIKDGRRLLRLLKDNKNKKPILIWKGGQTEDGSIATSSHSGSMAESMHIWEAFINQVNAIKVDSLEELIDTIMLLIYAEPLKKNGVGLISLSGGQCVNMTDTFAKRGFRANALSDRSYRELSSIFATVGASYRNPIDLGGNLSLAETTRRALLGRDDVPGRERLLDITLDILNNDDHIDAVVLEMSAQLLKWFNRAFGGFSDYFYQSLTDFKQKSSKPIIVIIPPSRDEEGAIEMRNVLLEKKIAGFPSFARGADALKKFFRFHQNR